MSSPVPFSSNANDNGHRKRSVARSFSSELGTVDEEEVMNANSLFEGSSREQTTQAQTDAQLSYSSGDPMERIQTTVCPREVMKTKIRYHFMNPLQKFRARRRKPWKLVLQIVKIVLVTLQVRFNVKKRATMHFGFPSIESSTATLSRLNDVFVSFIQC